MSVQTIKIKIGYLRRLPGRILRDIEYFRALKKRDFSKKKIYYFGVPEHSNLGDLAQCFCIRKYLKEQYSEYETIEVQSRIYLDNVFGMRDFLKTVIKENDLIFFQSGYCTQDIGGREDLMHQMVIQDFPNNNLVMLPQTIFFKSVDREKKASSVYNSHKKLLFLARDMVSYEKAKNMFPDIKVYAFPDIVTTLIGKYDFNYERKGILFCIRNDAEKFYSDEELAELKIRLKRFGEPQEQLDTTIREEYYVILRNLKTYIESYFNKFAQYKVVVTDRYHGTIFSLIANTPVVVIKTTDHKVKTGVEWFKGIYDSQVYYADSLEEADHLVAEILKNYSVKKNHTYFMEKYYMKLRSMIES